MRKVAAIAVVAPLLMAMTCNPDPKPYTENAEQCVRAMQAFAQESKERGKQMAVVANILGRSSLRQDEQTKIMREIADKMQTLRHLQCLDFERQPMTPVPEPTPGFPGG